MESAARPPVVAQDTNRGVAPRPGRGERGQDRVARTPRRGEDRRDALRARRDPVAAAHPDRRRRRGDRAPRTAAAGCGEAPVGARGVGHRRRPPGPTALLDDPRRTPGVSRDGRRRPPGSAEPDLRTHGIGRYAANWASRSNDSTRSRRDLPAQSRPAAPRPDRGLVSTGKVAYRGAPDASGPTPASSTPLRRSILPSTSAHLASRPTLATWPSRPPSTTSSRRATPTGARRHR